MPSYRELRGIGERFFKKMNLYSKNMDKQNMHFSFSALIWSSININRLVVSLFNVLICSGQRGKWLIKLPHWRVSVIITKMCQQMDFWNIMRAALHQKKVILKNGGL